MEIGAALFVVSILIVAIWVFVELKRLRHKVFAVFLIALILFTYISFSVVLKGQDIEWSTMGGVMKASKLYFSWLGSMFGNMKSITGYAVKMNWDGNETKK
ncbi:MAG: hypothetical protein ABIB79_02135 [archaeon]